MRPHELRIAALNREAERVRHLGDKAAAMALYQQAFQLIRDNEVMPEVESAVLSNCGILLSSLAKHELAIQLQTRALELDTRVGDPVNRAYSLHNLGYTLGVAGRWNEAIAHLEKALALREVVGDRRELLLTCGSLASAYREVGQLDRAEQVARRGLALRAELGDDPEFRQVLAPLAHVQAARGLVKEASQCWEEVLGLLERRRAGCETLEELDLYDDRYNALYLEAIEFHLDHGEFERALTLIDRTRFRSGCDALVNSAAGEGPDDRELWQSPPPRPGELLTVDWVYPKYAWSFSIGEHHDGVAVRRIETSTHDGPQLEVDLASDWRKHFAICLDQTQRIVDGYSAELGTAIARLCIIPHGAEWDTPFAALRTPDHTKWLLSAHELVLVPSLRYCHLTDRRGPSGAVECLVIGDPTENLDSARVEAQRVAELLGCRPILGREATQDRIRTELERHPYDVVHFAGHGDYDASGLSALILADGVFTERDLRASAATADLVNLSSCWNGMVRWSRWNEMHGMLRAVLIRGARFVIASAYPLGDDAALHFNLSFYREYVSRRLPAAAYRKAICEVADLHPQESWAGLRIIGQRPSESSQVGAGT